MERKCQNFLEDLLGSMRSEEKYSDFILKVGGEDIPVHRSVLSTASPYFEAMLSSDTIEKKRGWAEMFDLDPNAVKTCIDFLYSGKAKLSLENPEFLILASDLMQIPKLKEMYFEFLAENLTVDTCLLYAGLASKYRVNVIADRLSAYMVKNIDKIFTLSISKKSEKKLREALDLLPANLPNREMKKWELIEAWMKADVENRSKIFPDLFKFLLLDEIPLEYLTKDILLSKFVRNCDECRAAIMTSLSAETHHPIKQCIIDSSATNPRYIVARNGQSMWLHIMNLSTYTWSRYARLPSTVGGASMIGLKGEIYLRIRDGTLLHYSGENWEILCVLEQQLRDCEWLAFDDCIWFIERSSIRKYNPFTGNLWRLPAISGVSSVRSCAFSKDYIMLVAYEYSSYRLREYDFSSREWSILHAESSGISDACFINKTFIARSGQDLKRYDPNVDKWVTLKKMNGQESLGRISRMIASNQYLYLFGEGKGAVCSGTPLRITKIFDAPSNFSNFCLV